MYARTIKRVDSRRTCSCCSTTISFSGIWHAQGKWLIQENDEGMETQLKYAVEVVIEQDRFHIMKTLEPLLERILYTELPITMVRPE